MPTPDALREQLRSLLAWEAAHATFDAAVAKLPAGQRGVRPEGLPYSPWELLEHMRLAQRDLLDFCRDADYEEHTWPDDYWPDDPAPPSAEAWTRSVAAFRADREELQTLAADRDVDLLAEIPHGDGQTYLRELLLAADHAAYHVGELIVVRRLLGSWPVEE